MQDTPYRVKLAVWMVAAVVCVTFIGWPQARSSWDAALRYEGETRSDYNNIDSWIESAECTRRVGTWGALCADGRLVPLLADDPGHSIFLGFWAKLADRKLSHVDVARLNLMINGLGLLVLVGMLVGPECFWTAIFLLLVGPYVFLEWIGTSAHWAHIGILSTQFILPLSIVALATGAMRPVAALCLVVLGLAFLVLASLTREPLGMISLFVALGTLVCMFARSLRDRRPTTSLFVVAVLAVAASQASQISGAIRDAAFRMDTSDKVASHGFAHNLYLGLGVVPNRWGISWDDDVALNAAKQVDPGTVDYSRDYFRIMRGLYLERLMEDPMEACRIYFEKFRMFMAGRVLDSAPPLWEFLTIVLVIQLFATRYASRQVTGSAVCPRADGRVTLNLICLSFIAFFVLQAVLAHPSRYFAIPVGACMLVMAGIAFENLTTLAGAMVRRFARPGNSAGGT